jgi:hypothetical protein
LVAKQLVDAQNAETDCPFCGDDEQFAVLPIRPVALFGKISHVTLSLARRRFRIGCVPAAAVAAEYDRKPTHASAFAVTSPALGGGGVAM